MTDAPQTVEAPAEVGMASAPEQEPPAASEPPSVAMHHSSARAAWFVALLGAVALLLGRAISPALIGVWVGVDRAVTTAQLVAATATQLFALLAVGLTVGLLVAVSRARWPALVRAFAVGAVCLVTMAVGSAMFLRLPEISGVAAGACAGVLALMLARYAARVPAARAGALVMGVFGVGCIIRMGAIGVAYAAEGGGSRVLAQVAAVLTTVELLMDLVGALVVLGWLGWSGRRWSRLLVSFGLMVVTAGVMTAGVWGGAPDAVGWPVLANRAIGQLITAPAPLAPPVVHGFIKVLCWVLALAVLAKRWRLPMMTAAVSLALTAQAAPEAPLGAMALALAALMVSAGADSELSARAAA